MSGTCPAGHESTTDDYCDVCGVAMSAGAPSSAPETLKVETVVAGTAGCPNCGAARGPDDAFCEVCGLDFATGALPAPPPPITTSAAAPSEWVAIVEFDPDYFESNRAEAPDAALEPPTHPGRREVPLAGDGDVLVGRRSDSKGVYPDIDPEDPGVSRRHAVLRCSDAGIWVVTDEGSTNGTRINGSREPVATGRETPLADGEFIQVGVWTRITLRRVEDPGS